MLTVTCITGPLAVLGAIYFWRRNKSGIAFGILVVYVLLIASASGGPLLTEAGKSIGDLASLLSKIGQLLPK